MSLFKKIKEEFIKKKSKFKKNKGQFVAKYKNKYLQVINLTKQYKKNMPPAINQINFSVGPAEFHAFIGGNGAGKTTTIKSIVGAYANYDGEVYFSGYKNNTLEAKRTIGYIPEYARFPENMSTQNYLLNMAMLSEMPKKEAKSFVKKILFELKMEKLAKKSPNNFSSGQKKKILLAQALIHNPKILIMDEPAANLDPKARIEFFDSLKRYQEEGKSIFISSHILNEIDKYATHATILDGGKIVFTGSLSDYRLNKNKKIKLKVDQLEKTKSILEKQNILYTYNYNNDNLIIDTSEETNINNLLDTLIKNEIKIISFVQNSSSLEEIYYEYVIKGSVHTMD